MAGALTWPYRPGVTDQDAKRHSNSDEQGSGESVVTVVVAGAANMAIAVAKGVGALVSGSAAMLSEAVHSLADTVTEVLLFIALRRGSKPADARHPLGYGRESYLWALLAAMATFVAGAVVSVYEGVQKILHGEENESITVALVVIAVAFVVESISLIRALKQVDESAKRWRVRRRVFLRETSDTTVKAVTFEDSAALVGLVLAAAGLIASHATGSSVWDGLASVLIGLVLVVVAVALIRSNSSLLVGRAALPELDGLLRRELEALGGVQSVPVFVTTVTGPGKLIVAAKVEFADDCTTDDLERVADEAEARMRERFPGIEHVFLDPTASHTVPRPV